MGRSSRLLPRQLHLEAFSPRVKDGAQEVLPEPPGPPPVTPLAPCGEQSCKHAWLVS